MTNGATGWMRLAAACLLLASGCAGEPALMESGCCEIAQRYIDAANGGDTTRIAPFLAADVVAVFLSGDADHAEVVEGRGAVLESVQAYREQCPDCESTLVCHLETPSAAYVTEDVVFLDTSGEKRRQSAPLILEIGAEGVTHTSSTTRPTEILPGAKV